MNCWFCWFCDLVICDQMETVRLGGNGGNLSGLSQLSSRFWLQHGGVVVSTVASQQESPGWGGMFCVSAPDQMHRWRSVPWAPKRRMAQMLRTNFTVYRCAYVTIKANIWQSYSMFEPPCYCIVGHYHVPSSWTEVWSTFQDREKLQQTPCSGKWNFWNGLF